MTPMQRLYIDIMLRGRDVYALVLSCEGKRTIRQFTDMADLPTVEQWCASKLRVEFYGGARVQFATIDSPQDHIRYDGRLLTHILDFDHNLTQEQKTFMRATLRTPVQGWDVSGNYFYA